MSPLSAARRWRMVAGIVLTGLLVAGCGSFHPVYTPTGMVLSNYAESHATPYMLQQTDIGVACNSGMSLDPLVYSFSRVTASPNTTGTLLQVLAGTCGEREIVEEELRYLRASHDNNTRAMRDARSNTERKYAINATRRMTAFNRAMAAYDYDYATEGAACPCFRNNQDEMTFLFGLLSGMQAVLEDARSGGQAGVPRSLAPQVERAAHCVDSVKWAGIPGSLRAAVWSLLPDTRPDDAIDPWQTLKDNRQVAVNAGFRVAIALEMIVAENVGDDETVAEALAFLVESEEAFIVNPDYQMLDSIALELAMFVSDRIWTRDYGHRTPNNRFGRLTNEPARREAIDTDGLL